MSHQQTLNHIFRSFNGIESLAKFVLTKPMIMVPQKKMQSRLCTCTHILLKCDPVTGSFGTIVFGRDSNERHDRVYSLALLCSFRQRWGTYPALVACHQGRIYSLIFCAIRSSTGLGRQKLPILPGTTVLPTSHLTFIYVANKIIVVSVATWHHGRQYQRQQQGL